MTRKKIFSFRQLGIWALLKKIIIPLTITCTVYSYLATVGPIRDLSFAATPMQCTIAHHWNALQCTIAHHYNALQCILSSLLSHQFCILGLLSTTLVGDCRRFYWTKLHCSELNCAAVRILCQGCSALYWSAAYQRFELCSISVYWYFFANAAVHWCALCSAYQEFELCREQD